MKSQSDFRLFGIFGYPLGHTLSPGMQEAAFEAAGVKAFYLALELDRAHFHKAMRGLKGFLLDGFNVTVPYKGEVMAYLDRLTPEAKTIRAVNTVYRKGKQWIGANTDCGGFLTSLRQDASFHPRGKNVLVLGAGGSSRAVVYGLAKSGAREIRIVNRPQFRARRESMIRDFRKIFRKTSLTGLSLNRANLEKALENVHLVVNATSVGIKFEEKRLIPKDLIPKAAAGRRILFFDLVYHRPTLFLRDAKRKGHRTLNGLGMLAAQGEGSFRYWTGKQAPRGVMRRALQALLKES